MTSLTFKQALPQYIDLRIATGSKRLYSKQDGFMFNSVSLNPALDNEA